MDKKQRYNFITVVILIALAGLVVTMVKAYEIECARKGGTAQVAKATIRGLNLECNK